MTDDVAKAIREFRLDHPADPYPTSLTLDVLYHPDRVQIVGRARMKWRRRQRRRRRRLKQKATRACGR